MGYGSTVSGLFWLAGVLLWLFCIVDTLRRQQSYVWILLLIFAAPLGVIAYLLNFYVLDWAGWRRIDVAFSDFRRKRELERALPAHEIPGLRQELAQIQLRQRRYRECLQTLKPVLDEDAEDLRCQMMAGRALFELGRTSDALPHLEYVVAQDPYFDFGEALLLLAKAQEAAGQKDAARQSLETALKKSRRAELVVRYAQLLVDAGQRDGARKELELLVKESATLPRFGRRKERAWIARAKKLLRTL